MNTNTQHKDIYYLVESGTVVYASREHGLVVVYTGPELDVWREALTEKGVFGGGYKHLDSREVSEQYADPDRTNIEAVTQEAEDWVVELLLVVRKNMLPAADLYREMLAVSGYLVRNRE